MRCTACFLHILPSSQTGDLTLHDYLKPDTDFEYQRHYDQGMQPTAESVADNILAGSFAAIHTTTMTLTNVLYDLAAHPEYAEVLREEIQCISAEEPSGILRKKTMPKLRKLDSFIKESQRINPLGAGMLKPILIPYFAPESLLIFNSNATTPCHRAEGDPALQWGLSAPRLCHCRVQRSTDWRLRSKVPVTTASTAVTRRVPPLAIQQSALPPGRGEQASIRYHDKREYGVRSRAMGLPRAFLRIKRD